MGNARNRVRKLYTTSFTRWVVIISITLVGFAYGLQLFVQILLFNYGEQIRRMELLNDNLKMENMILKNNIAKASSLQVIEAKAKALGFVPYQHVLFIKGGD